MSFQIKAVLSAAASIEREWNKQQRLALQNAVRLALPKHRAAACMRHRLGMSDVTVNATASGKTRLGGLMVCDAFHVCPLCHQRKMAADKATITELVHKHYAAGGLLVDAVLTVPHHAREPLAVVLERLETVWRALRSKPLWRELENTLGAEGCIRRLEVTLTKNGWHPHLHVSFLCQGHTGIGERNESWVSALNDAHGSVAAIWARAGLKASVKVCLWAQAAVTVIATVNAERAVAYNLKNMGLGDKSDSVTPVDLLRLIDQVDDPAVIRAAKQLFNEYATAINGKHVLSLLGIARTLKGKALPPPRKQEESEQLGSISADGWHAVLSANLREKVAQVRTREELAALILRVATFCGYPDIPTGWLKLSRESKSVIEIKSPPGAVGVTD